MELFSQKTKCQLQSIIRISIFGKMAEYKIKYKNKLYIYLLEAMINFVS